MSDEERVKPLNDHEIERLRIHEAYLRRIARNNLADILDRAIRLAT